MKRIKAWLNRPVSKRPYYSGVAEFSSVPDPQWNDWAVETGALYPEQGGYGNVSLQEEGEAWRSTLCTGPGQCSS